MTSAQCDVCGKPAVQWWSDPWGKSDVKSPKCAEHGVRFIDAASCDRLRLVAEAAREIAWGVWMDASAETKLNRLREALTAAGYGRPAVETSGEQA